MKGEAARVYCTWQGTRDEYEAGRQAGKQTHHTHIKHIHIYPPCVVYTDTADTHATHPVVLQAEHQALIVPVAVLRPQLILNQRQHQRNLGLKRDWGGGREGVWGGVRLGGVEGEWKQENRAGSECVSQEGWRERLE